MFYVYLLASKPYGTLYIGTTSDLARRVWEHKNSLVPGFTKRYQVERLVWFEAHEIRGRSTSPRKTAQGMETRLENQFA